MKTASIGDPVEVSFPAFGGGVLNRPATVCYVDDRKIGVAFADGTRMMLERRNKIFRLVSVEEVA